MFFSPLSIAITSLGEDRTNLSAFRSFVRFMLVWFYLFPLPLGVWEGLRLVIVALPGLLSYFCFSKTRAKLYFYRLSDAKFYDPINTIYQFIKPFFDKKENLFLRKMKP